jgi:hypothetical protein
MLQTQDDDDCHVHASMLVQLISHPSYNTSNKLIAEAHCLALREQDTCTPGRLPSLESPTNSNRVPMPVDNRRA